MYKMTAEQTSQGKWELLVTFQKPTFLDGYEAVARQPSLRFNEACLSRHLFVTPMGFDPTDVETHRDFAQSGFTVINSARSAVQVAQEIGNGTFNGLYPAA